MIVDSYDYVIVGGGTAGLTVANRLSEDSSIRVLVIEAGDDRSTDPLILTPGLVGALFGKPEYDYNFASVPQPHLNNRKIVQPRGRVLGGSSALNTLMVTYPSRSSIDAWAALGNEGWSFDELAPFFDKSSTIHPPSRTIKELGLQHHDESIKTDGPIQISWADGYPETNQIWVDTLTNLGLTAAVDFREGSIMGAFQQPFTIDPKTKTRSYAPTAHYTSEIASRPNLTVVTGTVVKKITLDTTVSGAEPRATGVVALSKDGSEIVYHAKEVIVAAGGLMSPQILEVSGIGSKVILEPLGIPTLVENPNVGENLQDHTMTCQSFELNDPTLSMDVLRDPEVLKAAVEQYQTTKSGRLAQSNTSVANVPLAGQDGSLYTTEQKKAFFESNAEHFNGPDADVLRNLLEAPEESSAEYIFYQAQANSVLADATSFWDLLAPSNPENYLTISTMIQHPLSRGSVHITSPDVTVLPTWDPKYGDNPLDLEITARHIRLVERIVATEPFASLFKKGGKRIPNIVADDMDKAMDVVRQSQVSDFHPAGSCSMLPREKGGVVDNRLRVYGVQGIRVVDASIFPLEPVGHLQTVVYAVAEKAAQIIKDDRVV